MDNVGTISDSVDVADRGPPEASDANGKRDPHMVQLLSDILMRNLSARHISRLRITLSQIPDVTLIAIAHVWRRRAFMTIMASATALPSGRQSVVSGSVRCSRRPMRSLQTRREYLIRRRQRRFPICPAGGSRRHSRLLANLGDHTRDCPFSLDGAARPWSELGARA